MNLDMLSGIGSDAYANHKASSLRAPSAPLGAAAGAPGKVDRDSELYRQCQEFESLFVKMMLDEMKKTVSKSGLNDGGMAEEIFSDMLYDEYAKSMSRSAGFGLADQVYLQLSNPAKAYAV